MRYRDTAELITVAAAEDSDGYDSDPAETKTEVFVDVKSVTREEFYRSMQAGKELDIAFELRACDYDGQPRIEHNGKRYKIVRAYTKNGETLQLNCSEYRGDRP